MSSKEERPRLPIQAAIARGTPRNPIATDRNEAPQMMSPTMQLVRTADISATFMFPTVSVRCRRARYPARPSCLLDGAGTLRCK